MKNGKLTNDEQSEAEAFTQQIINELTPIVRQISKIVANAELPIGEISGDGDKKKLYDKVAKEVLKVIADSNIRWTDRHKLFQLALQPLDIIREISVISLQDSYERASDKLFGKDMQALRLQDLHKILKP